MHDDRASAQDLAALQAAVLGFHDKLVRMSPDPRSLRVMGRLERLHLAWLVIPWFLVDIGRVFVSGFRRGFPASEQQAVRLYRQLSGKDPHVARAEVWRIVEQLGMLDVRLRDLDQERPGAASGADEAELAAAAAALIGFYLAGRRTDDKLLGEVEAAWAEYEELTEQQGDRGVEPGRFGRRRAEPMIDQRFEAAADRYRAAWRRWLDRRTGHASSAGSGDR